MEYEIQFAKLATTEKLPDRFLNTQLKASSDLSKASMGQVFTLIEILTPWFPTAQIGQTIINNFIQNYYQGGSTSDLANFEEALKKVNETLAQITQNGETDWIGNLNGVLGVIVENKMHLAQTGKGEAYIFRDGKINHLTYGLAQNGIEPHPLKTFSNVTSGELKPMDKILIANPELYKHFSIESLKQIVTLNTASEAILQIAKILKKKKVSIVNVLVVHFLSREEAAKLPPQEEEPTIYLDRPLESIWAGVSRTWKQIVFPILKFIGKSGQKASKQSVAFTKNYLAKLSEKKKSQEPLKKKDLFDKEFLDENRSDGLLKDEEIQYSPDLNVHYYEENKAQSQNRFLIFFRKFITYLKNGFNFIIQLAKNKKTRKYFYVGLAIILLIIIGLIINARRNTNTSVNLSQAQELLKEAENSESQAESAILSNDTEKAKTLFADAINKSQQIQDFPIVGSSAKELLSKAYTNLDKLTATNRFVSLDPILTVENAKGFFIISSQAYVATPDTIYQGLLIGGRPEKVASIPKNAGDFQFGSAIDKSIFLYTSSQKIYEFESSSGKIDLAPIKGNWETANAIANYIGNIYLLDGIIGQIYKHPYSNNSFGSGQTYVNSASIDLKKSVSLAIDGSVYILRNNGEAIKLQQGKLQEFSLQDIPTPWSKIEKPLKIYTDADTPSIYVLDGGQRRILQFDKSGHFIHQYALPDTFNDLSDFIVSVKSKKIWILNKSSIYEINI